MTKYHHATRSDHKRDLPKTERSFAKMEQFAIDSAKQYEEAVKASGMLEEMDEADNSQAASLDAPNSKIERPAWMLEVCPTGSCQYCRTDMVIPKPEKLVTQYGQRLNCKCGSIFHNEGSNKCLLKD